MVGRNFKILFFGRQPLNAPTGEKTHQIYLKIAILLWNSNGWRGSVDRTLACIPICCEFCSWLGYFTIGYPPTPIPDIGCIILLRCLCDSIKVWIMRVDNIHCTDVSGPWIRKWVVVICIYVILNYPSRQLRFKIFCLNKKLANILNIPAFPTYRYYINYAILCIMLFVIIANTG